MAGCLARWLAGYVVAMLCPVVVLWLCGWLADSVVG